MTTGITYGMMRMTMMTIRLWMTVTLVVCVIHSTNGACADIDNCDTCPTVQMQCDLCPPGFLLAEDRLSCNECPGNCAICTYDAEETPKCLACNVGYLNEGQCTACTVTNCKLCTKEGNSEICQECTDPGYVGGQCKGCPQNQFLDTTGTLGCSDCIANCKGCSSAAGCSQCEDAYYYDSTTAVCTACSENCRKCEPFDPVSTCKECASSYGLRICIECSEHCRECSSSTECTTCYDGYFVSNNQCDSCPTRCGGSCEVDGGCTGRTGTDCTGTDGAANCASCNINADSAVDCQTCESSYTPSQSGACTACTVANCVTCDTAAATCTACPDGYRLDGNACGACTVANCATCDTAAATCTACPDGYRLDGNACGACTVANCVTCDADVGTCTACEDLYAVYGGACVDCQTGPTGADSNCIECTASSANDVECQKCTDNVPAIGGRCGGCDDGNCADCPVDIAVCIACNDGYVVKADNTCGACDTDDCKTCSEDAVTCTECLPGFFKDDDNECLSCGTGYAVCNSCPANCLDCSILTSGTVCDTCAEAFVVSNGQCVSCASSITNCLKCYQESTNQVIVCSQCDSGFYLTNGECTEVPSGLQCREGAILLGEPKCSDCSDDLLLTPDFKCGRRCNVCGSIAEGTFVKREECKTSAVTTICLSGICWVKSIGDLVSAGCYLAGTTCDDINREEPCEEVDGVLECEECCSDGHECGKKHLFEGFPTPAVNTDPDDPALDDPDKTEKNAGQSVAASISELLLVCSMLLSLTLHVGE